MATALEEIMTEENQTLRIVMLGKTGMGKSSLANTLYGEKGKFKESASSISETKACCAETTKINGRNIRLIDTPGLFDTDLNSTELSPDILKCIEECAPGPHAFLLVLKVERYTSLEQFVVDKILKYFSPEALKYTTVVFTHGDDLPKGVTIKDWAKENKALKTLIQKCGDRVHVFDNKHWNNKSNVRELLNTIEETLRENNGKYYTNKFLEFVINRIKEMQSSIKYAASVLLGALLGAKEFANDLFKRNLFVRLPTDEDTSLSQQVQEIGALRILLLGKTGSGKSSLANTIFGDFTSFMVTHGTHSSKVSQFITRQVNGKNITLIDSPGFFDHDSSSSPELLDCIKDSAPGPNAVLLVFKLERFTKQEQDMLDVILHYLSKEILKYSTVVFTHGDQLPEKMNIEEWACQNKALNALIQECGGRVHVFDNKYWNNSQDPYRNNQLQVRELLKTIDKTVILNGGGHYSNEMLQQV